MSSTVRLTLVSVSLFLLLFPLALSKPGLPTHLKADEAAYYLMALSLARDGDLRVEVRDIDRLFQEFPYQPVNNLILMTRDGWSTVHYGKPYIYSLLAAPFAGPFGADGLFFFNMLLTVAMIWMGTSYLSRFNPDGTAALYSTGFFLLSAGFVYVFWIQPEVLNMASVAACLYFGLPKDEIRTDRRTLILALISGAALVFAVYNKPMLAAVGIAPLWVYVRGRQWKTAGAWMAGAVVCMALVAGISLALTGTPTSYLGAKRGGFSVCEPGKMPVEADPVPVDPVPPLPSPLPRAGGEGAPPPGRAGSRGAAAVAQSPTGNAMTWLFRAPDTHWSEFTDNVGYFLWGRHAGLIPYLPFAALSVLLFFFHGRRSVERWLLLAATAGIALFFLLQIAWNWQGGGGFVGNRYFVNVYPAFLFLVTRIRPLWTIPAGYAFAGLFLGPLLFTPFGAGGPEPTLQAHVRNVPFRWLPLELTLRNVPGYHRIGLGDFRVVGRRDQFLPFGELMWTRGADPVEMYLIAGEPIEKAVFLVRTPAPRNRVGIELGDASEMLEMKAGDTRRLELRPGEATRTWKTKQGTIHAYRMLVSSETGRIRHWTRDLPPESCSYFASNEKVEESFFVGAELTYLGTGEALDADLYAVRWGNTIVPERVTAGQRFKVITRLFNRSRVTWPNRGGASVRLSYHWRTPDGRAVLWEGERTELPTPVPPGGRVSVTQEVLAPEQPGTYVLELDPVFENVGWFSEQNGGATFRRQIEVTQDAR
ncbi:MAG TPA: hypothetical protein VN493_22930 [Thermoanaerobaculia bacterium]|nr:hypothetical protein [Thermoanaerobaculia bacterium]